MIASETYYFQFYFTFKNESIETVAIVEGSKKYGNFNGTFQITSGGINDIFFAELTADEPLNNITLIHKWHMKPCPIGYGYNKLLKQCEMCPSGEFNIEYGWNDCIECDDGLYCLGSHNIKIYQGFWWDQRYAYQSAFVCRRFVMSPFFCLCFVLSCLVWFCFHPCVCVCQ